MAFLICIVAVCPVRATTSHKSEQTSQLLFGETCILLEKTEDFVRIRALYDNYEGWCQATQLKETDTEIFSGNKLAGEWINKIKVEDEIMDIPFASSLAFLDDKGYFEKKDTKYDGTFIEPAKNENNTDLLKKYAFMFLNTPYLWGGKSVFGIDCSGFTQLVFKCINVKLLRDAYQQAEQGKAITSLNEAKCGDLAFFKNELEKITHVGILLDSKTIIHASGKMRIDNINNSGIINRNTNKQTHQLQIIKRVIE